MSTAAVAAIVDLVRRIGVLRHPIAVTRILGRLGGSVPAAIELGALREPSHVAVARGTEELSYAELRTAMRATASSLAVRCDVGQRVGVETDGTAASLVLIAAALAAGLDVVPMGPRVGAADREIIRQREGLVTVLVSADARWIGDPAPARRAGRLLMLSSGSTGPARTTARRGFGLRALIPMADLDRRIRWPRGAVLVLAPLDHGHGLSAVVAGLLRGETVLLASQLPDASLADLVRRHRPAAVTGVPLQLTRAVRAGVFAHALPQRIVSGSSRLDDAVADELRSRTGATVIDCLGTTETGTFAVRHPPELFRPLVGVQLDVDGGSCVRVRSALADEVVYTGDLGHLSIEGLVLDGRADGLVDSAGELMSPERIAAALDALPQVDTYEVSVAADELRGAVVTVRVQVNRTTTPDQLREALLPRLGSSGTPRRIDVVGVLAQRPA